MFCTNKKSLSTIIALPLIGYVALSSADARSELILENNCDYPVVFKVKGDDAGTSFNTEILPNQYYLAGEYINSNTFSHTTSDIRISFTSSKDMNKPLAGVQYLLNNGWIINNATFKRVSGDMEVEHRSLTTAYEKSWYSYTLSGNSNIPSFTISACSSALNLNGSDLEHVNRVLIFGDSLSDQGNIYKFSGGLIPKSTPYYNGMFSNGNVWAVQFENMLKRYGIIVNNYSVGGATVVLAPSWTPLGLPYNLEAEVKMYQLDKQSRSQGENKLAIFFIGANDYLKADKSMRKEEMDHAVNQVVGKIIAAIGDVDADNTLIVGLPNLSLTIESKDLGNQAVLSYMSNLHNTLLKQFATSESHVKFIDLDKMFQWMLEDPEGFNQTYHTRLDLKVIGQSCWQGGYFAANQSVYAKDQDAFYRALLMKNATSENNLEYINKVPLSADIKATIVASNSGQMCNDPWRYIFWDHIHPTYQIQKALYQYVINEMGVKGH
ncbi:SGNH/GDSL hydrolase family protein [Cysteiniphilum halobium]|uniref:SGNH/GDSL hydrolase family protein n=1 Tax=Cysteiniphilum halobium TaxID=2219059 RepID=UPI003F8496A8